MTLPVAAIAGGFPLNAGMFQADVGHPDCSRFARAALVSLSAVYWDHNGGQTTSGMLAGLTYPTRLPIITPGVIGSLVFSAAFGFWMILARMQGAAGFPDLGLSGHPLVLSNQQIVTGVMFSARDWERTVSYPVLSVRRCRCTFRHRAVLHQAAVASCTGAVDMFGSHCSRRARAERTAFSTWRAYNMGPSPSSGRCSVVDADTASRASLVLMTRALRRCCRSERTIATMSF